MLRGRVGGIFGGIVLYLQRGGGGSGSGSVAMLASAEDGSSLGRGSVAGEEPGRHTRACNVRTGERYRVGILGGWVEIRNNFVKKNVKSINRICQKARTCSCSRLYSEIYFIVEIL